jgi:carbonic anhydrase
VIRSLAMSQELLGTTEIILVRHIECGLSKTTDAAFRRRLEEATGVTPTWASEGLDETVLDIGRSLAELRSSPFLRHTQSVRGFLYDERTGELAEQQ